MIWKGERVSNIPFEVQRVGWRKLRMIHNSRNINDLSIPPSNRLQKLKGRLQEFYSIRVNDQWRIIFKWYDGEASDVELLDYHK